VRKIKTIGAELDDFATDFVSLNQKSGFQLKTVKAKTTNTSIPASELSHTHNKEKVYA
jgi:biopolymer transport protein ExbB